jgi:disulfide bond formation protein DsbB
MTGARISVLLGAVSGALILGALVFQYWGGLPPCEMCHWQRWPHIAAAIVGIGGGLMLMTGALDAKWAPAVVVLTILLIAAAAALGVFHAGVEWKWWAGPAACTGSRVEFNGLEGLNGEHVVRCDQAAWRLFGISLAGYNAIVSLLATAWGTSQLMRTRARA